MPKFIAIASQKGGVGKTTTTYNLASALSKYNRKILVLDMDPQGNCSRAFGIDSSILKKTLTELLLGSVDLKHSIRKTNVPDVSLIPSNLTSAMIEDALKEKGIPAKETLLKERFEESALNGYDYVLIDCPPSLGFLAVNALTLADCMIIPVQCEFFALDALTSMLSSVAKIQHTSNHDLSIMGIVLTMYDPRTKLSVDISAEIRSAFKDHVFTTTIPRNVSIPEAIARSLPVNEYKPKSQGSLAYAALAREVLAYFEDTQRKKQ